MHIKSAEFVKSSARVDQCPDPIYPEYAFIGRSNVGKSTLINMLAGTKKLAKTSSTPGKTRMINHFLINGNWYLVDLPGYGYARAPRDMRKGIDKLISKYIQSRTGLTCLFLLIDVRHSPLESDISFIRILGENMVPFMLVFTKCDKLSSPQLKRNLDNYLSFLKKDWETLPGYFCTSALKKEGREEILSFIARTNNEINAI
jgi:GTP-binding protein